jgi:hypothetical protein
VVIYLNGVINYKNENGSTIFELQHLSNHAQRRIFREYQKQYHTKHFNRNCIKLISKETVLEISNNFISFFPELTPEDAEKNYKIIYKLVAQRSEIYLNNSKEKIELATQLLLGNDLRACISLLYYSLHNFVTGKMYQYLNETLQIDEHNVSLQEVDHFTSQLFFNEMFKPNLNIDELLNFELTSNNYHAHFGGSKNKLSANPFKILPIILKIQDKNILTHFRYCLELMFRDLYHSEFSYENISILDEEINSAINNKIKDRAIKQEQEVRGSIAYAFKKYLDSSTEGDKISWSIYIMALRLYWLRQNADYDYDFAVKTSTHEISLLLNSIQYIIKNYINQTITEGNKELSADLKASSQIDSVNNSTKENSLSSDTFTYFEADLEQLYKHDLSNDAYVYMTAIHLDGEFDFPKIIRTLNFSSDMTNRFDHYIYEIAKPFPLSVKIKLNKDGRWIIWLTENSKKYQFITQNDLKIIFEKFCVSLWKNYNSMNIGKYSPKLLVSYPKFSNSSKTADSLMIESIHSLSHSLVDKAAWITSILMHEIADLLKVKYEFPIIQLDKLKIYCRLNYDIDNLALGIPTFTKINEMCTQGKSDLLVFNLIVSSGEDRPYNDGIKLYKIYSALTEDSSGEKNNAEFRLGFGRSGCIELKAEVLQQAFNDDNYSQFFRIFTTFINNIAYDMIEHEQYDQAKYLIEKCLLYENCDSYCYATYGMLYLRDKNIEDLDFSLETGKKNYTEAIERAKDDHQDTIDSLEQKYHYELARFYVNRQFNTENYKANLKAGLKLGKERRYYNALKELELTFKQVSVTISSEEAP